MRLLRPEQMLLNRWPGPALPLLLKAKTDLVDAILHFGKGLAHDAFRC